MQNDRLVQSVYTGLWVYMCIYEYMSVGIYMYIYYVCMYDVWIREHM